MKLIKSSVIQRFEKLRSAQQANASISQCGYLRIKYKIKTSFNARALLFFFINLFILFIYFWLRWVFIAAGGLSLVVASRDHSSLRCVGFSLRGLLLLQSMGSRRAGLSSCGSQAQ